MPSARMLWNAPPQPRRVAKTLWTARLWALAAPCLSEMPPGALPCLLQVQQSFWQEPLKQPHRVKVANLLATPYPSLNAFEVWPTVRLWLQNDLHYFVSRVPLPESSRY